MQAWEPSAGEQRFSNLRRASSAEIAWLVAPPGFFTARALSTLNVPALWAANFSVRGYANPFRCPAASLSPGLGRKLCLFC